MIVEPLSIERWPDFEKLFGPRGGYSGCWCMWWRCTRKEFERNQGTGNKLAMRELVATGAVPGLLAYRGAQAIAWCAVAPRSELASMGRSPVLKPIDDRPVWSVSCFFVEKSHRGQGVAAGLLEAAKEYVRELGGECLEAYPTVSDKEQLPPVSSFMGVPGLFAKAGFKLVAQPSTARQIWRYELS